MPIRQKMYALFVLSVINFTHIVDSMIIMPLGDTFIHEFDITTFQYSFLVSSYAIAAAIASLVGIFFIDRYDRKKVLLFCYVGFGIGTLICAYSPGYYLLTTARFFTGLFGGLIGAIVLSIVSDLFAFQERGKAMGFLYAAFSAASAFGVPIGIYLAAKSNWQLPFLVIGGLAILISILIYFTFPNLTGHLSKIPQKVSFSSLTNILIDRNQVNALLAGFVLVMAHFMIIPFISPFMIKNIGFSPEQISLQFMLGGIATMITSPFIGKMTDKIGFMKVFATVMTLSFFPTIIITNLQPVPVGIALIFTTLFFVFGSGRMISPNAIITASAPTSTRGSFMALKSSLQQLAIAFTGIISGNIIAIGADGKYENYAYVGALSVILGIVTFYFIAKLKVAEGN